MDCRFFPIAFIFGTAFFSACSSTKSDDVGPNAAVDGGLPADSGAQDSSSDGGLDTDATTVPDGGLELGVGPPRRGDMAFAIDPATSKAYMFWGDGAEPQNCGPAASIFIDEAWVFDSATDRWAAIAVASGTPAPTRRARSQAVWDEQRGRAVIFGGRFRNGTSGSYTLLNDVWSFDPGSRTWTELSADGNANAPAGRANFSLVYDPSGDQILIHGGNTRRDTAGFTANNDTWAFHLGTNVWTRIGATLPESQCQSISGVPECRRLFHVAAFDRSRRRMLVFGGGGDDAFTTASFFGDLWSLDLSSDQWTHIPTGTAGINAPAGRIKAAMDYDVERDRLILFGGHDDTQLGNTNDVWTFDFSGGVWSVRVVGDTFNRGPLGTCRFPADFATVDLASPERRESHLFGVVGDRAFLFGGRTDCGLANDTWTLDLVDMTWRQITLSFTGMTCFRSGRTDCSDPSALHCG